jgi:hypothetical protein
MVLPANESGSSSIGPLEHGNMDVKHGESRSRDLNLLRESLATDVHSRYYVELMLSIHQNLFKLNLLLHIKCGTSSILAKKDRTRPSAAEDESNR